MATAASLEEFRRLTPGFEARGQSLDVPPGSVFKSPELGRYELFHRLPGVTGEVAVPPAVLSILGWSAQDAQSPGAYRLRTEGGTR
jgi:hypothetical protein